MKNVREVLRAREEQLARVREEVEALRVAAPLLAEEEERGEGSHAEGPTKKTQRVTQFP